jgi:hypothetical protein
MAFDISMLCCTEDIHINYEYIHGSNNKYQLFTILHTIYWAINYYLSGHLCRFDFPPRAPVPLIRIPTNLPIMRYPI